MDPYEILGVSRAASSEDIKRAFHKLAHKHHPDKGGDAEKFKKISQAYAQLKDRKPQTQTQQTRYNTNDRYNPNSGFWTRGDFGGTWSTTQQTSDEFQRKAREYKSAREEMMRKEAQETKRRYQEQLFQQQQEYKDALKRWKKTNGYDI